MFKLVIICFCVFPAGIRISYAQELTNERKVNAGIETESKSSVINISKKEKESSAKTDDADFYNSFEISVRNSTKPVLHPDKIPEKPKIDIVSSYRNNIHFGGFWNGYAILNFTPTMYIQPFDFISIYANHNVSMYVPVKGIRENIKSLVIEGAAVLAVDNSVKFLLPANHIVQSIAGFAAKNLVLSLLRNITNSNSGPTGMLQFKYYYYSVSVRF